VHAIGDQANKIALDVFQEVGSTHARRERERERERRYTVTNVAQVTKRNGKRDRRFRIEHAQHILPEDFARFAEIPVIASMQPYHLIDDGR
jgi:predicted amidohydrolase YtcJ